MGERITEAGCWAHARRKFFELHAASKSQIAQQALLLIGQLYELERQEHSASADERLRIRQQQSRPIIDKLYNWLTEHRSGSACLNSFTPRDKETTGGLNRCRVVHGGGRRLRRTGRRGGQLGEHQGFSFYAAACIDGSIAQ
jgi:hypothetical protein